MSVVWNSLHVCPICEEDVVPSGKRLCPICEAMQASMLRLEVSKPVPFKVRPLPWDFWDKMYGVIGGGLVVACLWAMWSLFR